MVKHRYCEPVHRHFPVVFVGAAYYVGERPCSTCLSLTAPSTAENDYSQALREGDGA